MVRLSVRKEATPKIPMLALNAQADCLSLSCWQLEVFNLSAELLVEKVTRLARHYGAHYVDIGQRKDAIVLPDPLPASPNQGAVGDGGPDSRRLLLRLLKLETLWNYTEAVAIRLAQKAGMVVQTMGDYYSHVVLSRDDLFLADDVHLRNFPDEGAIYSRRFGFLCRKPTAVGPNDQLIIFGGRAASSMLRPFSAFFAMSLQKIDTGHWLARKSKILGYDGDS